MKKTDKHNNFIIYMLLVVFLITGAGYGLGEESQVFPSCYDNQGSTISVPTLTASGEIHTFQVKERNSVTLRYGNFRNNRSETVLKNNYAFLCVLAILSVFFRLIQEVFVHFQRLYVNERFFVITFMQDTDGRKRIS